MNTINMNRSRNSLREKATLNPREEEEEEICISHYEISFPVSIKHSFSLSDKMFKLQSHQYNEPRRPTLFQKPVRLIID